jgi:hypothetical protein
MALIEAIHLAAFLRVNCFYVRHVCWFFWLSVLSESVFPNTKWILRISGYFFNCVCVSVVCYVSCLECVAICVSRSHSLYKKKMFSPVVYFFRDRIYRELARGKKGEKRKVWVPPFFILSYILLEGKKW